MYKRQEALQVDALQEDQPPVDLPEDAVLWEGNGHYYKLCGKSRSEHLSWTEAKQACEEMGGHLVTITSQEENDFVQSLHRGGSVQAWIGMSELDEIGNWKWVTGEPTP